MASTQVWSETNGASPGTTTDGVTNLNFGSTDAVNIVTTDFPVRNGENSFEKWVRIKFTSDGNTSKADNIRLYKSAGTLPANVSIQAGTQATYAAPVATASTKTVGAVPTDYASGVSFGNNLSLGTTGTVTYTTSWVVLQLQTLTAADPGSIGTIEFTAQWDEY